MISDFVTYLRSLEVSQETVPRDPMNNGPPFYYETGRSALRLIMTALLARVGYVQGDLPVQSILDFGSGYGRVTRWMRAAFPSASIAVTDLDQDGMALCSEHLEAIAERHPFERMYDLIFLGSVFIPVSGFSDSRC